MFTSIAIFYRFIVRDLFKNWVRSFLTIFGIALGVAVLLAISLANHTAVTKFRETVDLVSGKANIEIRAATTPYVDQEVLRDIRWLWMAGCKFTPLIIENVVYPNNDDGQLVQLIGIDMLCDADFKTYGNKSESSSSGGGSDTALLAPDTVLIGARLASEHNLSKGSKFQLLINDRKYPFIVAGVLAKSGLGGAFSGNLVITDISTAQRALRIDGKITQIEVIAPDYRLQAVEEKLKGQLPRSIDISRPAQRGEQVDKMTRSFEYNLMALAFIALMVGMFLIYNTMTISIIRRRPEIGTLRALGASKMILLGQFMMEALLFGVVGSGCGLALGLGFADGALKAVASTFHHFYFQDPIDSVTIEPTTLWIAFGLGVFLTLLAAIPPIIEAMNVQPAEATRRASYETKIKRLSGTLAAIGLVLLALAAICSKQPPVFNFPVYGYASALCVILGCAALMPMSLQGALPVLSRLLEKTLHSEGRLAARTLEGTLGRTSVAVASLMIGIAMMVSLAIMIGSFRKTVTVWIDQTLKADIWLQSAARAGGSRLARLAPELLDQVRAIPGVVAIDGFVENPAQYNGEPTNIAGGDFDVVGKYGKLVFLSGEKCEDVCRRVVGNKAVISETFAVRKHVQTGDILSIDTPHGPVKVTVEGIYYDYASDLGYIVVPRTFYRLNFDDPTLSSMAIYLAPGVEPESVRTAIQKMTGSHALLMMRTTGELRREAMRVFDRTFAVTYALHTIAIAVAMLAVMNALFALTFESKRDFGILRYIGASEGQIRKIVLIEAGLLGLLGNVSGLVLGWLLSLLLIFVINKQSFGWTVQLFVPADFLLQSSALVVLTAIVAGIIPARLAARTLAPSVIKDE
jgi:putative ABC transport system permease protein